MFSLERHLTPRDHPLIANRMLRIRPHFPGAAQYFSPNNLPNTAQRPHWQDDSLPTQLYQLLAGKQATVGREVPTSTPAVYLCTARSALPVAWALQAFFGEWSPAELPTIASIQANRCIAQGYRETRHIRAVEHREATRLEPFVSGQHVAIVEQKVDTGSTAAYAMLLARLAGASAISLMRGNWYDNVSPEDAHLHPPPNTPNTSFMNHIGQQTYARLVSMQ